MLKLPKFIRIRDEFEDVLTSVELVANLLPAAEQDPLLWKWILVAAHNGLQGAMVCALSGTDGTGALSERSAAKAIQWLQTQDGPHPEPWLADFPALLNRSCDPEKIRDGRALELNQEDLTDLDRLNRLRRCTTAQKAGA